MLVSYLVRLCVGDSSSCSLFVHVHVLRSVVVYLFESCTQQLVDSAALPCHAVGMSDNDHSFLPKRKLDQLAATPNSRSSGADVDGFFASGSSPEDASGGVSGGYQVRDARAGGGAAVTPVVKRRAIRYDRSPAENNNGSKANGGTTAAASAASGAGAAATTAATATANDTEAAAAAASALLAVRSSDGPKRCVALVAYKKSGSIRF